MQARVFIQPLANAHGDYQPREEVDPLDGIKLGSKLHKNKWSHGILASGSVWLALPNKDGRWGGGSRGSSVFALAGADGAKVEIEYPTTRDGSTYAVVWRGMLTSKGMEDALGSGIAHWLARTPDAALREARLNAGAIAVGQTLQQMLEAVFRQADVAAAMPSITIASGLDPNPTTAGSTQLREEEELLGEDRGVLRVLQRLLMLADGILLPAYTPNSWTILRRGSGTTAGTLQEVVEIQGLEDGSEEVFNQVLVETGVETAADRVYEARSEGSIARWGLRELRLDLKWMRHLENAARIADYLLARLQAARRCVSLLVDGWALPVSLAAGAVVWVDVPALAAPGSSKTGSARTGSARTAYATYPKIQGTFYVEEMMRDLDTDVVQLRLREVPA